MSRFPDIFAAKPVPKPISAARWVPLAAKHGMDVDFKSKCVFHEVEVAFWGEDWCEPDVGACVVKVAAAIDAASKAAS